MSFFLVKSSRRRGLALKELVLAKASPWDLFAVLACDSPGLSLHHKVPEPAASPSAIPLFAQRGWFGPRGLAPGLAASYQCSIIVSWIWSAATSILIFPPIGNVI